MEGERDRQQPGGEELWASAIPRPRANWKSVARTNTVAVCCSVLQCVSVCCSVLQRKTNSSHTDRGYRIKCYGLAAVSRID